jgi:hypothetical protein
MFGKKDQSKVSHLLVAEVDVEEEAVLDQLQRDVVALGAAAVQDDPVLLVGLEPEPEDVAKGSHLGPIFKIFSGLATHLCLLPTY